MKKISLLEILLCVLIALTSCNAPQDEVKLNKSINTDNIPEKVTIIKNYDSTGIISEYQELVLLNDDAKSFIEKIKEIEYVENYSATFQVNKNSYYISFDDIKIYLINHEYFYLYQGNQRSQCVVKKGDFNFLSNYNYSLNPSFVERDFSTYDKDYFKLHITKGNKEIEIKENEALKIIIERLKFYELERYENYTKIKYVLTFDDLEVNIYSKNAISFNDKFYYITDGSIELLDFILFDKEFDFEKLTKEKVTIDNKISVIDIKTNKKVAINEKEELLEKIKELKFYKLDRKFQANVNYIIGIGEKQVKIYENNLISYNNEFYFVTGGNLNFLTEINFDSTGWLPWV